MLSGINRNILECKGIWLCEHRKAEDRINRNILECKEIYLAATITQVFVLIETYWNVKIQKTFLLSLPSRINRNILECKVESLSFL